MIKNLPIQSHMTDSEMLVSTLLKTPEGRARLYAQLKPTLDAHPDYTSVARKVLPQ